MECEYKTVPVWGEFNVVGAQRTITLSANPPEGGVVIGGGVVPCGYYITVTAYPDDCYDFIGWTDENDIPITIDNPYQFIVTEDRTLIAKFEIKTFDIVLKPCRHIDLTREYPK